MIITLVSMLVSSMPSLMPQCPTINRNTADQQALVVKHAIMSDEIHWEVSSFK